jgi:opacity protein-like surface antigen
MNILPMLIVAGALLATTSVSAQTRRANNDRVAEQLNAHVLEALRAGRVASAPVTLPAPVATLSPVTVTAAAPMGIYVGAHAGSNLRTNSDYSVGGSVGYQFTPNYSVEVTYDYNAMSQSHTVLTRGKSHTVQTNGNGQAAMFNGVYSRRIGTSAFTPYVLAGAGMGWNNLGVTGTQSNATLYNVGAGLRVNLTSGVDFDARYRYIAPMDNSNGYANGYTQHVVTGGLRLNF